MLDYVLAFLPIAKSISNLVGLVLALCIGLYALNALAKQDYQKAAALFAFAIWVKPA